MLTFHNCPSSLFLSSLCLFSFLLITSFCLDFYPTANLSGKETPVNILLAFRSICWSKTNHDLFLGSEFSNENQKKEAVMEQQISCLPKEILGT